MAWSLDDKTVMRASTGLMYDQPILGGYEQALQLSGSPKAPAYTFTPTSAGAPAFPNSVSTSGTLAVQSPWAVDPNFVVARTWQTNVQVERSLGRDLHGVDRVHLRERRQPAGGDRRQPDQPDRHARRWPADLQRHGQRGDAPRSAVQSHPGSAIDRRFDLQGLTLQMSKRLARG